MLSYACKICKRNISLVLGHRKIANIKFCESSSQRYFKTTVISFYDSLEIFFQNILSNASQYQEMILLVLSPHTKKKKKILKKKKKKISMHFVVRTLKLWIISFSCNDLKTLIKSVKIIQ